MITPDSQNAFYEALTPDNAAMLLIDHQAGLARSSMSYPHWH